VAGSFPKNFGYGDEEVDLNDDGIDEDGLGEDRTFSDQKPRILLMGLRRLVKIMNHLNHIFIYLII
jgi:hypothetical protein